MAKRKTPKVEDLRPKKITTEELKTAKQMTSKLTEMHHALGKIETEKHAMLHMFGNLQNSLAKLGEEFRNKYGTDEIDIVTGEIKYNKDGTNNEADS